ncbi:hypothetical protein [Homoserinimonas hongtaonis]|uniref:Helicase-associated domain-containing protein n=1 Tax=Homoserinimonas hongtaonis TaxID=2079791 RepID=A0A2U1T2U2_9MICO|nr:hypothetical protein [Salinibacterium hongtaonis]PWB98186.1 hypothetical protein DF220_10360 [Salinibacterium hongtaonis]
MGESIQTLHEEYERLSKIPLEGRTDELNQSLRYYAAATAEATVPTRIRQWISNAEKLEQFVAEHSRMPRENSRKRAAKPKRERSLADWVRYQRRIEEKLCDYQARRLEMIEGFTWDPRRS